MLHTAAAAAAAAAAVEVATVAAVAFVVIMLPGMPRTRYCCVEHNGGGFNITEQYYRGP